MKQQSKRKKPESGNPAPKEGVAIMLKHPAEEQIRQRALEIHKARGGGPSQELDDWLQAERELLAEQERRISLGERVGSAGTWNNHLVRRP